MSSSAPTHPVAVAFLESRERLLSYLRRVYPRECSGRVEDAVGAAFLQALERPDAFERAQARGGTAELVSLMYLVARRQLRQECRRKSYRTETPMLSLPERRTSETPEGAVSAAQIRRQMHAKLEEATQIYGGRKKASFRLALGDRLNTDAPDTCVARDHGVPRESLCRARRWLMEAVLAA